MADRPIFYDHTGKRWRRTKLLIATGLLAVWTIVFFVVPTATWPAALPVFGYDDQPAYITPPSATPPHVFDTPEPTNQALYGGIYDTSSDFLNNIYRQQNSHQLALLQSSGHFSTPAPGKPKTPREILATVDIDTLPFIGSGQLLRVVEIHREGGRAVSYDPFSRLILRELSPFELDVAGRSQYVIERYGDTDGKRVVLTFDDGPDPLYTPQMLDMLAKEQVPAAFFATGSNMVKNPELTKRIVREGHTLGNHTYTHVDFDFHSELRGIQEINQTERVSRSITHHTTAYFRPPYVGNDAGTVRSNILGVMEAQRLGYTVTSYNFDSSDWAFPYGVKPKMPVFDGANIIVLLHDAGGDRAMTLQYVRDLINQAKAQGYTFTNLEGFYASVSKPLFVPQKPSMADHYSLIAGKMFLVWPADILQAIFVISLATIFITAFVNVILACIQIWRVRYKPLSKSYKPLVTVLVPSYNEETVLEKTTRSILASAYKRLEVIIINDGSKDNTLRIAKRLARRSRRVKVIDIQENGGKAHALNLGMDQCNGELVICMDADTIFLEDTIGNMIRHFEDPTVGAVAGVVKVGNLRNLLTRWQALEYLTGINIQRTAQALMGAITIVPGACGAWRRDAIVAAGGYVSDTLAEDCDLTLSVRKAGYRILQDTQAISLTESPEKFKILAKQRFRWTYGNIQAFWKHRDMLFRKRYGWLGCFVLPNSILSILLPLLFVPILVSVTIENLVNEQYLTLMFYFVITLIIQFFISLLAILLARESLTHLYAVPVARLLYGPLRSYLLYRSVLTVLQGANVGWNKFARTGSVVYSEQLLKSQQVLRVADGNVSLMLATSQDEPKKTAEDNSY